MPDGAHVGAFFSGLGKSLSAGLQRGAEQRAAEKSQADTEKSRQEDFIHQMLLSSAEHNPNLSVDDYHKILHTVLVAKGKKAGIPEDQITGLLGNLIKPVAKTFKNAPNTKEFQDTVLADKQPEMRDTTMGDVQAQQAERMTQATKVPVVNAQNAGRLATQMQRHADNMALIDARGDEKAKAAGKSRFEALVGSGMAPEDAKIEAGIYARALSDANLSQKQAGVARTNAQTNLANVRAQLAPQILAQRKAEAADRSSRSWKNLDRLERMTEAQIGATGLSKSDVGSIKGYMHTLDAMKGKVATDIDKARAKAEKEGKTPEEANAIANEIFDTYSSAAQSVAQSAEQVLGAKVKVDNADGWVSIAPGVTAPQGVATTGTGNGKGKGRGAGVAAATTSAAKVFPASKLQVYAQKYTNGDVNAARKRLASSGYTFDENQ